MQENQPIEIITLDQRGRPIEWSDASEEYFWIDIGPFFDRFGSKALSVTSSTDPVVQGIITLVLPRKYIDLKRADLPMMLDILINKSLIDSNDKNNILNTVTSDYERHIKGLPQPF